MIEVKERLWLTADRSRLVHDGHEDAAFLYCIPGQRVTEAEAQKFGLLKETDESLKETLPSLKEHFPAETKEIFPQENKRRRGKKRIDSTGEPCSD